MNKMSLDTISVRTGEYWDADMPLASRLSYRYMFAELVGTMLFTILSCGLDVSSGTLASAISYREDRSPGRILVLALGNGLVREHSFKRCCTEILLLSQDYLKWLPCGVAGAVVTHVLYILVHESPLPAQGRKVQAAWCTGV